MRRRAILLAATLAPALLAPAQELTFRHFAGTDGGRGWNDGPVATARLDTPGGVVADAAGNVYVADMGSHTIRKVTTSGVVTTLAGLAGVAGSADGKGISAFFNGPMGLALDGAGNLWVADTKNHTIRKVSPAGVVTTVAGSAGIAGLADGTGSAARFSYPQGLWWDSAGSRLLVADTSNGRVRSVTPAGAVSTLQVQGGAQAAFLQPVSVTANGAGDVFVVEGWDKHVVARLTGAGGLSTFAGTDYNFGPDDGPVYVGRFRNPVGVVSDSSGELWVADCGNHALRRVSRTGVISTVAGLSGQPGSTDGTGSAARFDCPFAIGRDGAGRFVIAEVNNGTVRRATAAGVVTTAAGRAREGGHLDGVGAGAKFDGPAGVVVDEEGNAWVADYGSATIRKVTPGGVVTTVAGIPGVSGHQDGPPGVATLYGPRSLARDAAGNLLLTSEWEGTVRRVSPDGAVTTVAGDPSSRGRLDGTGSEALFDNPMGIAVDASGNAWVADFGMRAVRKVTPEGVVTTLRNLVVGEGEPNAGGPFGEFSGPKDVEVGPDGHLYVADGSVVRRLSPDGRVFTVAGLDKAWGMRDGKGLDARFADAAALAFEPGGALLVLERAYGRVRRISADGVVTTIAGPQAARPFPGDPAPYRIALDGTGNGVRFNDPAGIAATPDGRVLVTDFADDVVRVGVPALGDEATVVPAAGAVGERRALAAAPQTAASWLWEPVRIEAGSTAALESASTSDSGFTPDVEGLFAFRLSASSPSSARLSAVSLSSGAVRPTAVLTPRLAETCSGVPVELKVELTGTPPWTVTWSDGLAQSGITSSPATRLADAPAELALASVTDANGPGSVSGSASLAVLAPPTAVVQGSQTICAGGTAYLPIVLSGRSPFLVTWSDGVRSVFSGFHGTRAVSPSATTTYSVVSVEDATCTGTSSGSATVTTIPRPTATVTGSTTICPGQAAEIRAELTGVGPWVVTWSDGFVDQGVAGSASLRVVSPGSTTTYGVTSVSDARCIGPGSGSATVTVLAGPAPSAAIEAPNPVSPGASGLVASVPDAGPGATYAWTIANGTLSAGQGTRAISWTAGTAGMATLRVSVAAPSGCSASGVLSVRVGRDPAEPLLFTHLAGPEAGGGWFDGPDTAATVFAPFGLAVDAAGNLHVADAGSSTIRKRATDGRFSTLAGIAAATGPTDGRGSLARFAGPRGIVADGAGAFYVADTNNHVIRKVTLDGVVTTVAGAAGVCGAVDGPLDTARFCGPSGIAMDGSGNLVVSDSLKHTIRRVTPSGSVSTLAGTADAYGWTDGVGTSARFGSPSGLAVDGAGNIWVADTSNHLVRKISTSGVVSTVAGLATFEGDLDGNGASARFRLPYAVAVDSAGNVLVADSGNSTIRRVTPAGDVTTLAGLALSPGDADGTGSAARFASPSGLAIAPSGDVFISDSAGRTIRRMAPDGTVTTVCGRGGLEGAVDGAASEARFSYPSDVVADSSGGLLVADKWNHAIRRIGPGNVVTTVAGLPGVSGSTDGDAASARFRKPAGLAVSPSGDVFVSDGGHTIRKISPGGAVSTFAGLADSAGSRDGTRGAARFSSPRGVAADAAGHLYVADSGNHTIRKISPSGAVTTLAGSPEQFGSADGVGSAARFRIPAGLAVDRAGNVFVADSGNSTIRKITPAGVVSTFAGVPGSPGTEDGTGSGARFRRPVGVRLDGAGNLWVTDFDGASVRRVTPEGVVTTVGGGSGAFGWAEGTGGAALLGSPTGIDVLPSGEVVFTDEQNHAIRVARTSLADAAVIDAARGSVGAPRRLDAQPRAATSWRWEVVRTEASSAARLSATDVPDPTFTPDVPGYYRFRLTASDGERTSVTLVSLFVDVPVATAVVSGAAATCAGESVTARFELTGIPPWTLRWSDGAVQEGLRGAVGTRGLAPDVSTTLTIASVEDSAGPGVSSGAAAFEVTPRTPTPVVRTFAKAGPSSPGRRASVAAHAGSAYTWRVDNGTLTAGAGTSEIVFTAGYVGATVVSVREQAPGQCASYEGSSSVEIVPAGGATLFHPLAPCRLLDTREPGDVTGGAPFARGDVRSIYVGGKCGIPGDARAISANVTVTAGTGSGSIVLYPSGETKPVALTVPVVPGKTRAAATHAKVSSSGGLAIANDSSGTVHVVVDVNGYYQ